jgi:hypothetical protein
MMMWLEVHAGPLIALGAAAVSVVLVVALVRGRKRVQV